jgi:hypothetical protein
MVQHLHPLIIELILPNSQLLLQKELSPKGLEHSASFKGNITAAPRLKKRSGVRRMMLSSPQLEHYIKAEVSLQFISLKDSIYPTLWI